MKRFEIRLSKNLHEKLREESFSTGKSMHEIVIELIEDHYNENEKRRLGMLKIIEKDHGEEKVLKEGTLEEITNYLKENENNLKNN